MWGPFNLSMEGINVTDLFRQTALTHKRGVGKEKLVRGGEEEHCGITMEMMPPLLRKYAN